MRYLPLVFLLAGCAKPVVTEPVSTTPAKPFRTGDEEAIRARIDNYFGWQKKGFKFGGIPDFNACRSYTILSVDYKDEHKRIALAANPNNSMEVKTHGSAIVRVEHSDSHGRPLVTDEQVILFKHEGRWILYDVPTRAGK